MYINMIVLNRLRQYVILPTASVISKCKSLKFARFEKFVYPDIIHGLESSYGDGCGPSFPKNHFKSIWLTFRKHVLITKLPRNSIAKTCFKRVRTPASAPSVMSYFVKTPQVIWDFLEVRYPDPVGGIPKRTDHSQEGCLAGAVLTHEKG